MAQEFHIEFAPRTAVHVEDAEPLGAVQVLVERVAGNPTQDQINIAVAEYIEEHPGALSPLPPAVKTALLQIAEKVAYIDENGQDYYDALDAALNAKALLQITAVYTQTGTVYDTDSLDSLKSDLVVTAYYDDGTTADVTSVAVLSGTLEEGTSTITATYSGKSATFDVLVSHYSGLLVQGTHTFSNGAYVTVRGNHISLYCPNAYEGTTGYQFNYLDINDNGTEVMTTTANANNKSTKFTIPAGSSCTFSIKNVVASGVFVHNVGSGNQTLVFGNRKASSTSNMGTGTYFGSGTTYTTTANDEPTGDYTTTFTMSSATNVGSLYTYIGHAAAGGTMEFDAEFILNGNQII